MEDVEFRQKLQRYKDTVYRIAYTYLRNQADAEDVSQDTFSEAVSSGSAVSG